jgi:hypothetical protein
MGRNKKGDGPGMAGEAAGHAGDVIKSLVSTEDDASRLLEMYYWTREPGIVALIRAYLDMPERSQRQLGGFLRKGRAQSIVASTDSQGRLTLGRADEKAAPRAAKAHGES